MKDSDSKSLETLYESVKLIKEDEAGRPFPYYGSNAAATSTPIMGTEPLTQAEVEVPEKAGEESEHDAEDYDSETSLSKLLDTIKDTIRDYEDKKQLRFNKELEESVINEINFNDVWKGAKNAANVVGTGVKAFKDTATSKNPLGNLASAAGNMIDAFMPQVGTIGQNDENGKLIVPVKNRQVRAVVNGKINPAIIGKITQVNGSKTFYTVQLLNAQKYIFAQPKDQVENDELGLSSLSDQDLENKSQELKNAMNTLNQQIENEKDGVQLRKLQSKLSQTDRQLDRIRSEKAKRSNKKVEAGSSTEDITILNKADINDFNKKKFNFTGNGILANFEVGQGIIGWAYPKTKETEVLSQKGLDKPKINTQFKYKGKIYVWSGNAWYFNKQPVRNNPPIGQPSQKEIQAAWVKQNGGVFTAKPTTTPTPTKTPLPIAKTPPPTPTPPTGGGKIPPIRRSKK